jgi:predicted transposase YbfD/YdcC
MGSHDAGLRRTTEKSFYVCNATPTAHRAAAAIWAHWGIKNSSYYARDVTMGEDRSRIRTKPGAFARLRSFAFNINKANASVPRAKTATGQPSQASKTC